MAHTIEHWLEEEGLSTFSDLARIGGRYVDYRQSQERIESAAEVGRFNRQLDLLNLALSRRHNELSRRIIRSRATESLADVAQANAEAEAFGAESRLRATERSYSQWLTASRMREVDRVGTREWLLGRRQIGVQRAQDVQRLAVWAAQGRQLTAQRRGEAEVRGAAMQTLAAQRGEQAVGRTAARRRYLAAGSLHGAVQRRIDAERVVAARGGALRIQARAEQAVQESGAGAVSGAARGMRGSYRQTTATRAAVEAARDIELYRLEDGLRQLQLSEQEGRRHLAGIEAGTRYEQEVARLGTEGARTTEAQARIIAGGREARAGFDVAGERLRTEHAVLGQREALTAAAGDLHTQRRWQLYEGKERMRREGLVEQAGLSLQEARAKLGKGAAKRTAARAGIAAQERTYEEQLGSMAEQIQEWQLKQLPSLPDYEAMGTRNALSMVFRTVADLADDD